MTKTLRKAIMFRSQLKSKFIKSRNNEDSSNYKKQRNFCTNLLKKSKQNYSQVLNTTGDLNIREGRNISQCIISEKLISAPPPLHEAPASTLGN